MGTYAPLASDSSSWREPDDPASGLNVDSDDLVEEETESKNWKGIIIAILVIISVLSMITVAIILVTPDPIVEKTGAKLALEEYINGLYEPITVKPVWDPDGKGLLYKNYQNELVYVNCETNTSSQFLDNSTFRELNTDEYFISPDRSYIIFPYQRTKVYEHSHLTRHKVYNTDTRLYRELIGPRGHTFQYVTWTNRGQGLVVVQGNDIFFREFYSDPNDSYKQLTSTGEESTLYNGVPDWLYGETILQSEHALWLSPDDNYMIYAVFNDSRVETMETVFYGDPKHQYTEIKRQRYPKIGTRNPTFQLKIYNFKLNRTETISPPDIFKNCDHYFTTVMWRNNISVVVIWLNRSQNISVVTICSALTAECYENLKSESEYGWVEMPKSLLFTPSRHEYFITLPLRDGDHGYFMHVALIDARVDIKAHRGSGKTLFLTGGRMEVSHIVGFYEETQTVYFLGIPASDRKERHLYNATINKNSENFKINNCMTCDLDIECLYMDAKFGDTGDYYILECLGPGMPSYHLYKTPDTLVKTLEDNSLLRTFLSTKLMPVEEFVSIPHHADPNIHITGKVVLPPILKKKEIIRYNLVLSMPTHIGEQRATHKFHIGWEHFMSSFHSIIVALVDTRGSKGRGQTWSHSIYRNLGALEVEDVITSVGYFKSLNYVSGNPAVIGKGYGGFLSTAVLSSDLNNNIKCGVASAPITDLNYIDTSYEKYTKASGNTGYNGDINLSKTVANLRLYDLLLLHGTLDDKIHFQHTAQYIKSLVASGVYHQVQIYPDKMDLLKDNSIKGHVLIDAENFLLKCFGLPSRVGAEQTQDDEDELNDYEE